MTHRTRRRTRRRTRLGALLAALLVIPVLAFTGCSGIPRSGPVGVGTTVAPGGDTLDIDFLPAGPAQGASQEDILRGFVQAASSPQNGYTIAKSYLTNSLKATWNPDESVTVDRSVATRGYTPVSENTWQLQVTPVASVNAIGDYAEVSSGAPVTLRYKFAKVGGEWRISAAPDGTVIDAPTFTSVFSPFPVYFYDPGFHYLVPDLRWFPSRASIQTRIVNALLAGPSKWLAGAIATAFPPGVQLAVDGVGVQAGQAQVNLNGQAAQADELTMQRMKLQLQRSLFAVTSVHTVAIQIDGTDQTIPNLGNEAPISDAAIDARPLVLREGAFGFVSSSNSITAIPGLSAAVAALKPTAVTVSADQKLAAALTSHGVYAVQASVPKPVLVDPRPGLIPPSLDNYGYLWSVPAGAPGALEALAPGKQPKPVATSWGAVSRIVSFQVSRDGTRAVALLVTGTTARFVAVAIIRDPNGNAPVKLGDPLELAVVAGEPLSATWVDELNVASLTRTGDGETVVITQRLGGQSAQNDGPPDGAVIIGAGAVNPYWVLSTAGTVKVSEGTGWQDRIGKVDALATQLGLP